MITLSLFTTNTLVAKEIKNTKNTVNVATVVNLVNLVNKPGVQVNILVSDLGGSTDRSPTQEVYFTIYLKGEMVTKDASFLLGPVYSFKTAKRVSDGVYEVKVVSPSDDDSIPEQKTLVVNAEKAILSMKNTPCKNYECISSTEIDVTIK